MKLPVKALFMPNSEGKVSGKVTEKNMTPECIHILSDPLTPWPRTKTQSYQYTIICSNSNATLIFPNIAAHFISVLIIN